MQAEERSHATKREINQKEGENPTYVNGETDRSNLKSSPRGSILRSQFFNQTNKATELLRRSQRTLEKWFLERLCV